MEIKFCITLPSWLEMRPKVSFHGILNTSNSRFIQPSSLSSLFHFITLQSFDKYMQNIMRRTKRFLYAIHNLMYLEFEEYSINCMLRSKRFLILFPQIINYLCCLFSKGWNMFTRFYPLFIRQNSSKYNTVEGVSILTSTKHVAIRSMCCSKGSILLLRLLPNDLCHVRSRLERKYAVVKAFSIFNAFLCNIYRAVNIWYNPFQSD